MKKTIAFFVILVLGISLCACKPKENSLSGSSSSSLSSSSTFAFSSSSSSSRSATREETLKIETFKYPEKIPQTAQEMVDKWPIPDPDIPVVEAYADEITVSGEYELPPVTNETPLEKLLFVTGIGTVIETNANCDDRWTINEYRLLRSYTEQENQYRPINFLRQTQPGCYYTVQKVEGGGYVYLFFERNRDANDEYLTEDLTDVYKTGCVYLEKVLQKSDFDTIQIGSTIDEVMAVDNAASITKIWAEFCEAGSGKKLDAVISKHLLKDGLLVYKYGYEGDTLVVTDIIFSEEFLFVSPIEKHGITQPKHFAILPQDYPQ